jgi:5,10-methylene-tetrahydrofolate dehydrogenase/methenyl tetrahydrofolate cyclohydrolase
LGAVIALIFANNSNPERVTAEENAKITISEAEYRAEKEVYKAKQAEYKEKTTNNKLTTAIKQLNQNNVVLWSAIAFVML